MTKAVEEYGKYNNVSNYISRKEFVIERTQVMST